MQQSSEWLELLEQKGKTRSTTGVVIFPGVISTPYAWKRVVKQLSHIGDVWLFCYPNSLVDQSDFLMEVTKKLKRLHFKKLVFVGISFGGTLAYLLMRYWKGRKIPFKVVGLLAVSSPFSPDDITFRSKIELALGWGLDRHAKRLLLELLTALRIIWSVSFGLIQRGFAKNSIQQMWNSIRQGYILRNEWIVQKRFLTAPAMLLNVADGLGDPFVIRRNEESFKEIFPKGEVFRELGHHADLHDLSPSARRVIRRFLKGL